MTKSRMGQYRRWHLRVSVHESATGDFRSTVELWAPGQGTSNGSPVRLEGEPRATAAEAQTWAVKNAEEWIDTQPEPWRPGG